MAAACLGLGLASPHLNPNPNPGPNPEQVRVDGGGLWPDETTEAPMQPVYALMPLEALASNPVLPEVMVPTWAPAEPGGDAAASDASPFMTDGSGEPAAFA